MSIVAGWYADPARPGTVRWWDGTAWTGTTAPLPPTTPVYAPPAPYAQPVSYAQTAPYAQPVSYAQPAPYAPAPYAAAPYGAGADDDRWSAINLLVPQARTLGVRALVWGIVAVLLPIAFAPAVMALVFGAMGVDRGNRLRAAGSPADGRGLAVAGLWLGGISLATVVGLIVLVAVAGR